MYSIDIITSSINLYIKLKENNIVGTKRLNYITSVFGIHRNTLYSWLKIYYCKETNSFNFDNFKTKFKYNNTKITLPIEQFIINSIDSNNRFNIKKIKNNIEHKFNVQLSKSSIYYVLHKHNFTYKNTIVKNIPYNDDTLNKMKDDLNNKISTIDTNNFVSYDEISIYLNCKNTKGWSIKGKKCIIKTKNKSIVNKRYTLGMAIDIKNKIDFTIVEGALKSNKFNTFMNKICKNKKNIFMDNASIHKNHEFNNLILKNGYNIIYNIPYHSHLNPIEYIFSLLRRELLSNDVKSINDIIQIVLSFSKNLKKESVSNIFNKCFNDIKNKI